MAGTFIKIMEKPVHSYLRKSGYCEFLLTTGGCSPTFTHRWVPV